jgi:mRNA interferase RelE/StbE
MQKQDKADSSNKYRIFETNEFIKKLDKMTNQDKSFIESKLRSYIYPQIKEKPHFGINIKKLKSYNPETWRYRLGKFRLFYIIEENEKIVVTTHDLLDSPLSNIQTHNT